jgi:four helix bundle protein
MGEEVGRSEIRSFTDLRVWSEAMDLVEHCYSLSSGFPRDEMYGLTSQLRRAAVSMPANIAEGYGRENTGSYVPFLRIAQGSLRELQTHLLLAQRLKFGIPEQISEALTRCETVGKMLSGLIRSLNKSTS